MATRPRASCSPAPTSALGRHFTYRSLATVGAVVGLATLAAGCGGGDTSVTAAPTATVTVTETATATATTTATPSPTNPSSPTSPTSPTTGTRQSPSPSGGLSRARAKQIALNHIGQGRVTDIGREDDFGAMWEVEITRPNGTEVDVYVSADGRVVHTS